MENAITLEMNHRPSALFTLYKGFRSGKHRLRSGCPLPLAVAEWSAVSLSAKYLNRFSDICEIKRKPFLPVLYPFTLIYPLNLRLISQEHVRVPMLKMLTIRNETIMHRKIQLNEKLDVRSVLIGQLDTPKGMEFYVQSTLTIDAETVWENKSTIFVPGKPRKIPKEYSPVRFRQIPKAAVLATWYLRAKDRFGFARVMGDSNGIHYSPSYARMLGFGRDFAQPIRIASKCLEYFDDNTNPLPIRVDLLFKGPVYYERELTLKSDGVSGDQRFDLFCAGNERPCICGNLTSG